MSWTCCCCDEVFEDDSDETRHVVEDDSYCGACAESELGTCERCGDEFSNDSLVRVVDVDEYWCPRCRDYHAECCDSCREWTTNTHEVDGGSNVCEECIGESYCWCETCETYFLADRVEWDADSGRYLCEDCAEGSSGRRGDIHGHDYRPTAQFFDTPKDKEEHPLYFGVEVEMEVKGRRSPHDVAAKIAEEDDSLLWYCKHDGSLTSQGVEVVSHPFTMSWMRDNPNAFAPLFNRRGECLSYNTVTCGMHVHMSINAFSGLHLFKFSTMFFHNPGFILLMSRRHPDRMNQWSACDLGDVKLSAVAAKKDKNNYRYCALNYLPRHTVECRIFRGTLSPAGFYGNIEFLHGLYLFSKRVGIKDITIAKFSIFMRDNIKDYPNFAATLGNRMPISMERRSADVHSDLQASGEDD